MQYVCAWAEWVVRLFHPMTDAELRYSALIADWFVALGTLAAVLVAIFGDSIRALWRRPQLRISCKCALPDCVSIPMEKRKEDKVLARATATYLRVLVTNKGRESARNVEVYARELEVQRADSGWEQVREFPPMNLGWSNLGSIHLPIIGPRGSHRYCDIGHVLDPEARLPGFPEEDNARLNLAPDQASLTFDLIAKPLHQGHIVAPGVYRLSIEVSAENARPVSYRLQIDLRRWFPDEARMLRDGVGIRIL